MEKTLIQVLTELLAANAEVQGMIAENMQRQALNQSMGYDEYAFFKKAEEIRTIGSQFINYNLSPDKF